MSLFVTIEGVEGCGKTTLIQKLVAGLQKEGTPVVVTREPGGTPLGKEIRQILLRPSDAHLSPRSEMLLFAADRAQHVHEVIRPALSRGDIVISDRYFHSTLAYQSYGRGIDLATLLEVTALATENLEPDLTLLLDIDPAIGVSHASKRSANGQASTWNHFEQKTIDFHNRVRHGFLEMSKRYPYFVVLNADRAPEAVAEDALAAIRNALAAKKSTPKKAANGA